MDVAMGTTLTLPSVGHLPTFVTPRPRGRSYHVVGIVPILDTLRKIIDWPLSRRSLYDRVGIDTPRGILLHGTRDVGRSFWHMRLSVSLMLRFCDCRLPRLCRACWRKLGRSYGCFFQRRCVFNRVLCALMMVMRLHLNGRVLARIWNVVLFRSFLVVLRYFLLSEGMTTAMVEGWWPWGGRRRWCAFCTVRFLPDGGEGLSGCNASGVIRAPAVVAIAETNLPECLVPTFRRSGRFYK